MTKYTEIISNRANVNLLELPKKIIIQETSKSTTKLLHSFI